MFSNQTSFLIRVIPYSDVRTPHNLTYTFISKEFNVTGDIDSGFRRISSGNTPPGNYTITVVVSDGRVEVTQDIIVTVLSIGEPPVMEPIGDQQVYENSTLTIDVNAADADNNTLTYGTNTTSGIFNTSSGIFIWTPTNADIGIHSILFTVSDGNYTVNQTVRIMVLSLVNNPPILEPIADVTVNESDPVQITANASDVDNDTLTYFLNDSRFNQSGNIFEWQTTVGDAGNYSFNVSVFDGQLFDWQAVKVLVLTTTTTTTTSTTTTEATSSTTTEPTTTTTTTTTSTTTTEAATTTTEATSSTTTEPTTTSTSTTSTTEPTSSTTSTTTTSTTTTTLACLFGGEECSSHGECCSGKCTGHVCENITTCNLTSELCDAHAHTKCGDRPVLDWYFDEEKCKCFHNCGNKTTTTTRPRSSGGGAGGGGGIVSLGKPISSCFDGILNQGEESIDCGGPCSTCMSCSDGIQNQGESGVDCGGPCSTCKTGASTITTSTKINSKMTTTTTTSTTTTTAGSPPAAGFAIATAVGGVSILLFILFLLMIILRLSRKKGGRGLSGV